MMFQTAPPDRGFFNNQSQIEVDYDRKYEQLKELSKDERSNLNSDIPRDFDILDRQLHEFQNLQNKEAKKNKKRPNLQENLSKMTSSNFSDSNLKSSLETRPNKQRLNRLEANYLQRLPVRQQNHGHKISKGQLPPMRIKKPSGNIIV